MSEKALKKRQEKEAKEAAKKARQDEIRAKQAEERAEREAVEAANDYATGNYGTLPMLQSETRTGAKRTSIHQLTEKDVGQTIVIRARVHNSRMQGWRFMGISLKF